jgi:hypothetical protein
VIPVRLPADFTPHIVRDDCLLDPDHPLYGQPCPVCTDPLGVDQLPVALVAVGVAPDRRKPSGWTSGAAVAVHTACARPAPHPSAGKPIVVTVHDEETGETERREVPLNNYAIIPTGSCHVHTVDVFPMDRTHVITLHGVGQHG